MVIHAVVCLVSQHTVKLCASVLQGISLIESGENVQLFITALSARNSQVYKGCHLLIALFTLRLFNDFWKSVSRMFHSFRIPFS